MGPIKPNIGFAMAWGSLSMLGACAHLAPPPASAEVARLADMIGSTAQTFYTELASKTAPDCSFEANAGRYAELMNTASALRSEVESGQADPSLLRAADKLSGMIESARKSHELASTRETDPAGVCMAPGAITLNKDAIVRSADSIENLQRERGAR